MIDSQCITCVVETACVKSTVSSVIVVDNMADEEVRQDYVEGEYYEEGYEGNGDGTEQFEEHGVMYEDAEGEIKHGEEEEAYQTFTEFYSTLQGQGVSERLAARIDYLVQSEIITPEELDDRAVDGLKEFSEDDALQVIEQFSKSDLSHVQNKSAFLCGVMKTHRTKTKQKDKAGTSESQTRAGPNEEKVKELLEKTGYTLDITTGQRKYGGPPPGWEGPAPGQGEKVIYAQDHSRSSLRSKLPLGVFSKFFINFSVVCLMTV